jgi:hypothetical protein
MFSSKWAFSQDERGSVQPSREWCGYLSGYNIYGVILTGHFTQWPYSYEACDVGTLPNQTYPGTQTPIAAVEDGDPYNGGVLVC